MDTFRPYSRSTASRDSRPRLQPAARSSRSTMGAYSGRADRARRAAGLRPACSRAGRGASRRNAPPESSSRVTRRSVNSRRSRSTRKLGRRSSPAALWLGQLTTSRSDGRAQVRYTVVISR